jgi:hypothetical protein
MAGTIYVESDTPLIAGQPAPFRVIFRPHRTVKSGGRFRLIYGYRGSDRQESSGQITTPTGANYISSVSTSGLLPDLRTYSVTHSYEPFWSEEPECFMWLKVLGPEVSLNCHVVKDGHWAWTSPAWFDLEEISD